MSSQRTPQAGRLERSRGRAGRCMISHRHNFRWALLVQPSAADPPQHRRPSICNGVTSKNTWELPLAVLLSTAGAYPPHRVNGGCQTVHACTCAALCAPWQPARGSQGPLLLFAGSIIQQTVLFCGAWRRASAVMPATVRAGLLQAARLLAFRQCKGVK